MAEGRPNLVRFELVTSKDASGRAALLAPRRTVRNVTGEDGRRRAADSRPVGQSEPGQWHVDRGRFAACALDGERPIEREQQGPSRVFLCPLTRAASRLEIRDSRFEIRDSGVYSLACIPAFAPTPHVFDMCHRLRRVPARQRFGAGWVPLHREEVEPTLGAEHVQLLGEIGAVAPCA
jgi:hypothetical protein